MWQFPGLLPDIIASHNCLRKLVDEAAAASVSPSEHVRQLVQDHLPDHHTHANWMTAPLYHDSHLKAKVG